MRLGVRNRACAWWPDPSAAPPAPTRPLQQERHTDAIAQLDNLAKCRTQGSLPTRRHAVGGVIVVRVCAEVAESNVHGGAPRSNGPPPLNLKATRSASHGSARTVHSGASDGSFADVEGSQDGDRRHRTLQGAPRQRTYESSGGRCARNSGGRSGGGRRGCGRATIAP
jgi:hypothetical protein